MSELTDLIKSVSHNVSEEYLLMQQSMNDAILQKAASLNLNEEVVKRICELSNQNVYLSLFHNPATNKANIQFELADSKNILDKLQKSENDMKDYKRTPKSFKSKLDTAVTSESAVEPENFQQNKLAALDTLRYERDKHVKLLQGLETMKVASESDAKEAFGKIFRDTKNLVANGESVGDLAKVAMRQSQDLGLNMTKVASAYNLIINELKDNGFTINEEITKLSSLAINPKSKILEPVIEYALSVEKLASFNEMVENTSMMIKVYDTAIEKVAGLNKETIKKIPSLAGSKLKGWYGRNKEHLQSNLVSDVLFGGSAAVIGGKIAKKSNG